MNNPTANKVAIIDCGIGNLHSVSRACEKVGLNTVITYDKNVIESSIAVILPGMGAFGDAMANLKKMDLINPIIDFASSGKYMMGVCLGMQLLMSESSEFGTQKGLGIINGDCRRFSNTGAGDKKIRVPQIMWNKIYANHSEKFDSKSPLANVNNNEYMYFVHSYYVVPEKEENILSLTTYEDFEYCSSIKQNNIFAFQFHPEKSGKKGLEIYKSFASLISENKNQS